MVDSTGDGARSRMRDSISQFRSIFDRRTKAMLALATAGSGLLALLDTLALALVVPVVDLATSSSSPSAVTRWVTGVLAVDDHNRQLTVLAVLMVALFVAKDVGQLVFNWWLLGVVNVEKVRLSIRIIRGYLSTPWTVMSTRESGEMLRTMQSALALVFDFTISGTMNAAVSIVSITMIAVTLAVLAPLPTLVVGAYLGLIAVAYVRLVRPRLTYAGQQLNEQAAASAKATLIAFGGMKEVILRRSGEHFVSRYADAALKGARAARRAGFLAMAPRYLLEIAFIMAFGAAIVIASSTGTSQALFGTLALFATAGLRVLPAASLLVASLGNLRVGLPSLAVVADELRRSGVGAAGSTLAPRAAPLELSSALTLRGVTFTYPGSDKPVIDGVDLTIPAGSSLALVGGSGAGKTTLADLVLGLHRPDGGLILADGKDIREHPAAWASSVGYVPQDVYVFEGTLAENIAFDVMAEEIDQQVLARAISLAQLEDVVQELPDGVDTVLGERGSRISGGQRQRVGIARALYRRPLLMVLDEATSALDNETERRFTETLEGLRGQVTVVTIAHRLSSIKNADVVVMMQSGKILGQGGFTELRAKLPEFERLARLAELDAVDRVSGADTVLVRERG